MASYWIPHLLALEVSTTTRQAQGASRSSAADPRDEPGKSSLGRSSHPWRTPQARHRCRPDFGCQVHGPTPAPTVAGLENVPPEPFTSVASIDLFGEQHLRRLLRSYQQYYNGTRTHLSLGKD